MVPILGQSQLFLKSPPGRFATARVMADAPASWSAAALRRFSCGRRTGEFSAAPMRAKIALCSRLRCAATRPPPPHVGRYGAFAKAAPAAFRRHANPHALFSNRLGAVWRASSWQRAKISVGDSHCSANSASSRASLSLSRRIMYFTASIAGGRGAQFIHAQSRAAAAPAPGRRQFRRKRPPRCRARCAASTVILIRRMIAGCVGS